MDPITFRAIERIIAVLMGGLGLYLGYQLLLNLPQRNEATGEINLPGGVSIYISRVGPGLFLALFGAIVIALSFYFGITYSSGSQSAGMAIPTINEAPAPATERYVGVGANRNEPNATLSEVELAQLKQDILLLNTLPLTTDLTKERQIDIDLALGRVKRALIRDVWDDDWGSYIEFQQTIIDCDQAISGEATQFQPAIELYCYGNAPS